jgi:hypothetical protein
MSTANWASAARPTVPPWPVYRITFPELPDTRIWYHNRMHLKVKKIQYRKEIRLPFRHEYLVVYLSDGSACRFDRRPDPDTRLEALTEHGPDAVDTVTDVGPNDLENPPPGFESERLATFELQNELDLYFIFLICYGIQHNPVTKRYTLQQYNCYFFSWTIILNVARASITWEGLQSRSSLFEVTFPKNIILELSQAVKRGMLEQSLVLCGDTISRVLAQIAILLPSRLSPALPLLVQQKLSHSLQNAAHSRNPWTMCRWKLLEAKMDFSLEQTLTDNGFLQKLSECMSASLDFSSELGGVLYRTINSVLRRTLWRHKMKDIVTQATRGLFVGSDLDDDDYMQLVDSVMWKHAETTVVVEITNALRATILDALSDLVGRVVASSAEQDRSSADTAHAAHSWSKVIKDTVDASMCDVLQDTVPKAFRKVIGNEKDINDSIARALGSVIADILPDAQLPFSLRVSNSWSLGVRDCH